jgi:hypothetical protein
MAPQGLPHLLAMAITPFWTMSLPDIQIRMY